MRIGAGRVIASLSAWGLPAAPRPSPAIPYRGPGKPSDRDRHGSSPIRYWGDQAPQCRRPRQGKVGAGPGDPAGDAGQWHVPSSTPWPFPAAAGRCVWRRASRRLDGNGQAAGVRHRHRRLDRRADGAVRLPRPEYDPALKEVFTQSDTGHRHRPTDQRPGRRRCALEQRAARGSGRALRHTGVLTPEVAAPSTGKGPPPPDRHHQSRRERPVIWDMGADRDHRQPEALELFRTVLLSSAAIPAVFPPGFINVDADGGTTRRCMSMAARPAKCSWCQLRSSQQARRPDSASVPIVAPTSSAMAACRRNTRLSSRDAVDRRARRIDPDQEPRGRRSVRALSVPSA